MMQDIITLLNYFTFYMQTFIESGLRSELLESIEKIGFVMPTPIQAQTIPFILNSDNDLVAMAQTGTGKTAAFGLPVLHKMDQSTRGIQAIILCPTRELCLQITSDLKSFATGLPYSIVPVYGGAPIFSQIAAIQRRCDIVVGTPGRVNDMIRRNKLDLSSIRFLVLDEADEMLKMGFKEDMDAIMAETPEEKQTLLFSATMPPDIARMAGKHMHSPKTISVSRQDISNKDIDHEFVVTAPQNSYEALRRIADINPDIYGIVFCRTRQETKDIADKLMSDGYNADALHGDLSQSQRDYVMGRFRNKSLQILVATDVAARGLDVDNLTHVIHYHLPDDSENYIHRSGRTGRAGRKGVSIAILAPSETRRLSMLEKQTGRKIVKRDIPSGEQVFELRLRNYLSELAATGKAQFDLEKYSEVIRETLNGMSREELIEKLIARQFNSLHEVYSGAQDLNKGEERRSRFERNSDRSGDRSSDRNGGRRTKFGRYIINLGARNNIRPEQIISLINKQTPNQKISIGKIDIQGKVSVFEADSSHESQLIKGFKKARFNGMAVTVVPMDQSPVYSGRRSRTR